MCVCVCVCVVCVRACARLAGALQLAPLVRQVTKALKASEEVMDLIDRAPQGAASGSGGQILEKLEVPSATSILSHKP